MYQYQYRLLDPRPQAREAELAWLQQHPVLGIEVTVPELAAACSGGNIDPQHAGQDASTAACEAAMDWPLPSPSGQWLATIRPDLDAFAAMAALEVRLAMEYEDSDSVGADGYDPQDYTAGLDALRAIVAAIGRDDREAGEWAPGQDVETVSAIQALKALCFDHDIELGDRVAAVQDAIRDAMELDGGWENPDLDFGVRQPHGLLAPVRAIYADRVVADRREFTATADAVRTVLDGRVAVVESASRFAVQAAYLHADVVVAVNPQHRLAGAAPHRKVTLCQRRAGLLDLAAAFVGLGDGWGGSPTVGGSPQGVDCVTSLEDILAVVERHLS